MIQKVIQIGNSIGIIIPQPLAKGILRPGDTVNVEKDMASNTYFISKGGKREASPSITPEFFVWLKRFNSKYKTALQDLAKK